MADHASPQLSDSDHLLQQEAASSALDLRKIGEPNVNSSLK
jgi:hypothetical protein